MVILYDISMECEESWEFICCAESIHIADSVIGPAVITVSHLFWVKDEAVSDILNEDNADAVTVMYFCEDCNI